MQGLGLRVPDDLSLITNDASAALGFVDPPLAAIAFRPRELGERAAHLLLRMLDGQPSRHELLPTFFDPRSSCAAPPQRTSRLTRTVRAQLLRKRRTPFELSPHREASRN